MRKQFLSFFLFAFITTQAQVGNPVSLLPNESLLFKTVGTNGSGSGLQLVDVTEQPFKKAYHISTINQSDNYTFQYEIDSVVQKGDLMLLSFYTRSIQSKKETGESFMEISLDRIINGKYEWPPVFDRGMSFGSKWVLTQIPFVAARDVQKGHLSFVIKCGKFQQVFEVAGIKLLNYKQSAKLNDLPRTVVHYDGDALDAPWRKAAAERIEKYRKGDLMVTVVNENGKRVKDAKVSVQMKKNAYAWGTTVSSNLILDTINQKAKMYRDTLMRYFNKVVFDNEIKSKSWARSDHAKSIQAIQWLNDHGIPARGHVMVWPSWTNSPQLVNLKNDTAALRSEILKEIEDETTVLKGKLIEWDVVNEPYANHNIMDLLGGKQLMVDWFNAARKNLPDVKLFLNEFTMFLDMNASDNFYNNIKYLKENNAPLDAIGEQGHIGGNAPGIEYIIERLNHFAEFGLPIQISEFDITSDDDDFKARYLRDFLTAVYSHPATIGVIQWGFWAPAHWIAAAALWDKDWNIRPEGKMFTELVSKTWSTNTEGVTSKNGEYKIRGFTGDYEITVNHKGKSVTQKYTLDNKGGNITISLQ